MSRLVTLLAGVEVVPCPVCGRAVEVVPEVLACTDGPWFVERPAGEVERECERQHGVAHHRPEPSYVTV